MAHGERKNGKAAEKPFAKAIEVISDEAVTATSASKLALAASATDASPAPAVAALNIPKKTRKPEAAKSSAATTSNTAPALVPDNSTNTRNPKETIMADANTTNTTDFTATTQDAADSVQNRMKAAYEKGTELTSEATEFQKGNFEALVESGKILASGMQDMGRTYVEDAKSAVETVQDDVRKMAAVKSPTELFQLQSEIARRNFDAMIAATSKNSETFLKLAGEAFAPVSSRMSLAADKFSKAA